MKSKTLWYASLFLVSAVAWGLFIFFRTPNQGLMRIIHVLCFAPFALSLLKSIEAWFAEPPPVWVRVVLPAATAAFLEWIQRWTPPHNPGMEGLTASLIGVTVGVVAYQAITENTES